MTEKLIFNNFDAWKYPIFFNFTLFEIFRGAFAPLPPYGAAHTWLNCIFMLGGVEMCVLLQFVGKYQGYLKGESVVVAILPSRMEASYCTSVFFVAKAAQQFC